MARAARPCYSTVVPPLRSSVVLSLAALLCGCVAPAEPPVEEPPPDDDDAGGDDDDSYAGTGEVEGRVVDLAGQPVAELSVSLCGVTCRITPTDADGVFLFVEVPAGTKVLEPTIAPVADGEELSDAVLRWSRFFDFVTLADGEQVTIDEPYVLYPVDNAIGPLTGAQTLTPAAGLSISFDADVILDDGPLPVGADGVWLGAIEIAPEHWPTHGLDGWTVEAAWGLAIWDLEAPDAFSVTAELTAPVGVDREVAFLVADYTYGFTEGRFWYEPADLDADGVTLQTPDGGGLDRATLWLAASRPLPEPE